LYVLGVPKSIETGDIMDGNYYKQSVEIQLERDSDMFRRIEDLAEKTGKPVEEIFSWAVLLGIEKHLDETVRVLERIHTD
jgi:hypothetical protein